MQFNSATFLFAFLPAALAGYYLLFPLGLRRWAHAYVFAVSLVFYAWAGPIYAALLLVSTGVNYALGRAIERRRAAGLTGGPPLWLGVIANLAGLGYCKYANFFVDNLNGVLGSDYHLGKIILPLAISFYTFQQIAFLVDVSRGEAKTEGLLRYATFVFYFPRITAGPIVHYNDVMPQLAARKLGRFACADLLVGLGIFGIGLFKKTVIAGGAAGFAAPAFAAAEAGEPITLVMAWTAAISYTFQLYFDFSGYSDMAVGVSRMFGVVLPPNFHSPLRSPSIIDYWRRWHISLQQLIVSYVYQPLVLPLTRWSMARDLGKWPNFAVTVALPSLILFVAVGFWHGAAWTFILFGVMHGAYLTINEFWRALRRKVRRKSPPGLAPKVFYHLLTLICVAFANVMFRADDAGQAARVWAGMVAFGNPGDLSLPPSLGALLISPLPLFVIAAALVALFPNTQQLFERYRPVLGFAKWRGVSPPPIRLVWRPTLAWSAWIGAVLFLGIVYVARAQSAFIYVNF
jgi:D-alanyl-lipoteichoic acid acyltransferase DltB (MBOAT superfamily)